ncbi:hypothetical protein DNFV4_01256 [Nitrospira tepida]|uniref:Uncharacterized protein n=1 Tax=Nitrospira tepida TaxID=2973512 RepID=A0AA86MXL8_9BACT|nr:hypothetical protein [Nitrospira tepida]CAI4030826.1 hypothetical protein DNFV4_01256 [Nitrospira tepida]
MTDLLKGKINVGLYGVMAMNLVVFYVLLQNEPLFNANWMILVRDLGTAVPAGVGLALTGILNAQLTSDAKARLVFMRWNNPLPGSEAFTKYIKCDSRIDVAVLKKSYGPFPSDPRAQNALWYRLYKSVEAEPAVVQVHRAFLFARDYTALVFIVGIVLGLVALFQFHSTRVAIGYLLLLTLHFEMARRAASNHGRRFVTTVLSLKSAGR